MVRVIYDKIKENAVNTNQLTIPPSGNLERTKEFEATCTWMAREYQEATAEIRRLLLGVDAQSKRLDKAFPALCAEAP